MGKYLSSLESLPVLVFGSLAPAVLFAKTIGEMFAHQIGFVHCLLQQTS